MNTDLILQRTAVVRAIRRFFDEQRFTEVFTPRLVGLPGQEPYLDPMWTSVDEQNGKRHEAALITSPEYAMKKLLGAGMDKIYDLGPCFRNGEPWDAPHDPEFLMLEWYRRDAGIEDLMKDTEEMIKFVTSVISSEARNLLTSRSEISQSAVAAFEMTKQPFRRLTVSQAMKQFAGVDLEPLLENREAMAEVVHAHGQTVNADDTWEDLFFKVFLSEVEPKLGWAGPPHPSPLLRKERESELTPLALRRRGAGGEVQPTFLTHYPASMAALARRDPVDPRFALRVELYIGDLELANGFAELADPVEQRKRFEEEQALRRAQGKKTWPLDEAFLSALPGMGNAAGIAFGVDRLAMLLTGAKNLDDLLPIPKEERFS